MKGKKPQPKKRPRMIYGIHPVMEALRAGQTLEKVWLRSGLQAGWTGELRSLARELAVPVQQVPEARLDYLSWQAVHQGVVAQLPEIEYQPLEELLIRITESEETPLVLMLDGITDVRNLGAIARTAECMGVHAIVTAVGGSAAINPDALKTSAGALNHIAVSRVPNLTDALYLIQSYGLKTVACTEHSPHSMYESDLTGPVCLIMGAEDKGISTQLLRRTDLQVLIPMSGKISSLNVSVAAGIALAELNRQRNSETS